VAKPCGERRSNSGPQGLNLTERPMRTRLSGGVGGASSDCSPFPIDKTMNTNTGSWLSRINGLSSLIGIPVLAGAWWAFPAEKLFIIRGE